VAARARGADAPPAAAEIDNGMRPIGATQLGVATCAFVLLMFAGGGSALNVPLTSTTASSWTVYHGTLNGNGVAPAVSSVNLSTRAWTSPALDGQLYGEPLVSNGRIYVATENDTVYALSPSTGAVAWSTHLGTPVPSDALPCGDISPTVGITGTPVVDPARSEVFVVADELVDQRPAHELIGLDVITGKVELTRNVDPTGSTPAALLQRTGLTLDANRVVFGFGGNFGDCSTYHGWVVSVPETGGPADDFEVDSGSGQSQGAVWMGGAAPVVDSSGNIWVEAGNGSVTTPGAPYDNSDSVLELSPALTLLQYFAPSSWATENARDQDLATAPALLPDGQVMAAGKDRTAYLLNGAHLGAIDGEQSSLPGACAQVIAGGAAVVGTTVYLPCLSGTVAVQASSAPASLRLLWRATAGGGPPVVAAGLVWSIGQDGTLYGLSATTGAVVQQASVGVPANHFPTPAIGGGLILAAGSAHVVAFSASSNNSAHGTTTTEASSSTSTSHRTTSTPPSASSGTPAWVVLVIVLGVLVLGAGIGWWWWLRLRRSGRISS
jgi:polyvinyl alcohol dehydrogenase (cytochrome)